MAFNFRDKPVDRRRLDESSRSSYSPAQRLQAIARSKRYKEGLKFSRNAEKFRTEQTPGTGGQNVGGIWQQRLRTSEMSAEKERAESFRPEKIISSDVYAELYQK